MVDATREWWSESTCKPSNDVLQFFLLLLLLPLTHFFNFSCSHSHVHETQWMTLLLSSIQKNSWYITHTKNVMLRKNTKIKKTFWLYTDGHFSFQCSCTENFFLMCFWLLNDKRTPKIEGKKKDEKFVIKTNSNFFPRMNLMINEWRVCRHNNENN